MENNNTNTNTINRDTLSEADNIFIPKDFDNNGSFEDYAEYKVGFYRVVPENCVLISVNRFTGKVINRGGAGFKLMPPFITKSILVSTVDRTIDYDKISYLTQDGIMANFDIALVVKITDPVKYITSGKQQLDQLKVITNRLLRIYAKNRDYDVLSQGACKLSDFDPKNELKAFKDNYGIEINKVIFKEVTLPKDLQRAYDNRKMEEENKKAQKIRLDAEKDKAETEAEILKIKAQAEAESIRIKETAAAEVYVKKMEQLILALRKNNIPDEGIAEYLKTIIVSEKGNAIFMGGNDQSSTIAKGVAAGNVASRNRNNNSQPNIVPKTNSEKLLELLKTTEDMGIQLNNQLLTLQKALQTDPQFRQNVDNRSEEEYKTILLPIINKYMAIDNSRTDNEDENITRGSVRK